MNEFLRVEKVEFLVIFSQVENDFVLDVKDSEIPSIIADIFSFQSWNHVEKIFECLKSGHGYGSNGSGIYTPKDALEDGVIQENVLIYNPIVENYFSEGLFYILVNRYLMAVLLLAQKKNDKALSSSFGKALSLFYKPHVLHS
jgi:hypothetical protein